jgi:ribonuclease T
MGEMDQAKPEVFLMVDVESSGPIPGDYSMLSLGAVVIGQHRPPYHKGFYVELAPYGPKIDPEAMKINKLDIEKLQRDGTVPSVAMNRFREWVVQVANPNTVRPVMVSLGTYDYMWVTWYFHHFEVRSPFGPNSLDMKSMYFVKKGCRWSQTQGRLMKEAYPDNPFKSNHNALDDCICQAELYTQMMKS